MHTFSSFIQYDHSLACWRCRKVSELEIINTCCDIKIFQYVVWYLVFNYCFFFINLYQFSYFCDSRHFEMISIPDIKWNLFGCKQHAKLHLYITHCLACISRLILKHIVHDALTAHNSDTGFQLRLLLQIGFYSVFDFFRIPISQKILRLRYTLGTSSSSWSNTTSAVLCQQTIVTTTSNHS